MTDFFTFSLAPELTPDLIKKIGFSIEKISASYYHVDEIRTLDILIDSSIGFEDSKNTWSIEEYGLILDFDIIMKKPRTLFEDGTFASPDDCLKIAFRVNSQDSRQKMIFNTSFTITNLSEPKNSRLTVEIPPGKMRKTADIEMLLYLSKSGKNSSNQRPGTIFGRLFHKILSFSGEGSEFPINTMESDDNFLWKLEMDYEDPRIDRFDQSVMLWLNSKHPKYNELDIDTDPTSNIGFMEIMTQATFLIIEELSKTTYMSDIISNNGLEPGSLGQAAYYMIITYAPDYDNPIELMDELHRMVWSAKVI